MTRNFFPLLLACLLLTACGGQENDGAQATATGAKQPVASGELVGLAGLDTWIAEHPVSTAVPTWRLALLSPIWDVKPDPSKRYLWKLETSQGPLTFELFADFAPRHVINAAFLSRIGFYDGLSFHRVIPNFMAQGGCPNGDGRGGPGYGFGGEFDPRNPGHEGRGMLSTANAGPRTDGSQFFITFAAATGLDGKHTVWGRMIEGEDTLRKLEKFGTGDGTPKIPLRITKAVIVEVERG